MAKRISKNIQVMQKQREDVLDCALIKITGIMDDTKMYRMKNNVELMTLIMSDLKSKIKFVTVVDSENTKQLRYIVTSEDPELFSKNISEMLFSVCDDIVCQELYDFEQNLKQYLKYAEDEKLSEYKQNIRVLMGLASIQKNKKMEDDLFSIQQNILSSLRYNDRIQKEIEMESVGV